MSSRLTEIWATLILQPSPGQTVLPQQEQVSAGEHIWDTVQWDSVLGIQLLVGLCGPTTKNQVSCYLALQRAPLPLHAAYGQIFLSVGHGNLKPDCLGTRTETACVNNEHEVCDTSESSLSEYQ